jgi:hypothetical protein
MPCPWLEATILNKNHTTSLKEIHCYYYYY